MLFEAEATVRRVLPAHGFMIEQGKVTSGKVMGDFIRYNRGALQALSHDRYRSRGAARKDLAAFLELCFVLPPVGGGEVGWTAHTRVASPARVPMQARIAVLPP